MALDDAKFAKLTTLLANRKTALAGAGQGGGFVKDAIGDIAQTGREVVAAGTSAADKMRASREALERGEQGIIRTGLQQVGAGAQGLSSALGALFKGAVKTVLPERGDVQDLVGETAALAVPQEETVSSVLAKIGQEVGSTKTAQEIAEAYNALDPVAKRDVDAALGGLSLIGDFVGGGLAKKPVVAAAEKTAELAVDTAKLVGKGAAAAAEPVVAAGRAGAQIVRDVAGGASRIIPNTRTNLAARAAARETIDALPSDTAKLAARDGVSVQDARTLAGLAEATDADKAVARELAQVTRKVAAGEADAEAALNVVGGQITRRLKTLERAESKVGAALGEVARTIPALKSADLAPAVLARLKKVSGLDALRLKPDGSLDFTGTSLASKLTAADRRAIQSAYSEAVKDGAGLAKHRYRQELREVITGKKRGSVAITDTQDAAFNAIRGGISDAISARVPRYGTLSQQFARIADPVDRLRKVLKATDATEDEILNVSGSAIARRLTSNAPSRAQIREILNAMDDALGSARGTATSVSRLQDLYNVLERYFDIAPKSGFQGQIKSALEGATPTDIASRSVARLAGQTPEVRQAAIIKLLEEVLGGL